MIKFLHEIRHNFYRKLFKLLFLQTRQHQFLYLKTNQTRFCRSRLPIVQTSVNISRHMAKKNGQSQSMQATRGAMILRINFYAKGGQTPSILADYKYTFIRHGFRKKRKFP